MKSMIERVHDFHVAMGLPTPLILTTLSVSARERRLRLTFEEFLETMKASGFYLTVNIDSCGVEADVTDMLKIEHIEGSQQDLVEIADGIGDQLVTNIGHALEHGIDIAAVFDAIMDSNMTKLDSVTGKPIINGKTPGYRVGNEQPIEDEGEVEHDESGYRPDLPVGKILKPPHYRPPDIESVLNETNAQRMELARVQEEGE